MKNMLLSFFRGSLVSVLRNLLLVLCLMMLCRVLFFAMNAHLFHDIEPSQIPNIVIGGLRFDLSAMAYFNALYVFLALFPIRLRCRSAYQKMLRCIFVVLNSVMLAANCADLAYFRNTLRRTTAGVFSEFGSEQNLGSLFTQFLVDYWYVFAIWALLTILLHIGFRRARAMQMQPTLTAAIVWHLCSAVVLAAMTGLTVASMRGGFRHSTRPITLSNAAQYVRRPLEAALVQNTPFCIIRTIGKKKRALINTFPDRQELNSIYNPLYIPKTQKPFTPKNIVIIIWESLSKEYVGTFNAHLDDGKYSGYTPFLDSLIKHSLTFTRSYANGRKSIDAMPAVLASIPSVDNPFMLSPYSQNTFNSIASLLRAERYSTAFFHGGFNGSMGFQAFANMAGFENYYGKAEYNNDKDYDGIWGIWDEEFMQFFAEKLNKMEQPFCVSLFTLSSHHPFNLPAKHANRWQEGPHPITKCMSYTDYALKQFFSTAQNEDWYENTLFVITADHANHPLHAEYESSVGQMSVPIIYFCPDGSLQGMVDAVTQQTDIMPTILSYLNYDLPYIAFGQNALDTGRTHTAINWLNGIFHIYENDYALLFDGEQTTALYHLPELNDVQEQHTDVKERMERKAKAFIQQYNNRMLQDSLTVQP